MESDFQREDPKSRYNSAIAQLYRMDELWRDCHKHSRNKEYLKWNLDLDSIWRELSEDAKGEDEEEFNKINSKIATLEPFMIQQPNGFNMPNPIILKKLSEAYKALHEKEVFLRRLMNKQGKGTAYEDTLEDEFE